MDAGGGTRSLEPRRSDSRRNRDRVLEAAITVLSERPDATVEDVAAAAGLNRSTVYRRFSGRDALLRAVRERVMGESQAIFREAVAREPDFAACMESMLREAVRHSHARRRIMRRLVQVGAMPGPEAYEPRGAFVEWLAAGQRGGHLRDDVPVEWLVSAWMQLVGAGSNAAEHYGIAIEDAARMAADAAARALGPGSGD
jgi:AcrR family transcriptional regulator